MANPRVKDGYIAFANSLFKAMMRTGPLEERVFKAILWECWGWEDRRAAKEPVAITRGQIAKLTGITHKTKPDKKPDLSNILKTVEDCLSKIVIVDDARIVRHSNRKLYADDAQATPGVFIRVRHVDQNT